MVFSGDSGAVQSRGMERNRLRWYTRFMLTAVAVPSITDFYFSRRRMTRLGASALAEELYRRGHSIQFFDFPSSTGRIRPVPLPAELADLKQLLLPDEFGPTSFFTGYRRLGPDPHTCAQRIVAAKPDALLISCFAFAYSDDALALARAVRQLAPGLPIAVGGAGPSAAPEYYVESGLFCAVAAGEAETCIDELLDLVFTADRHGTETSLLRGSPAPPELLQWNCTLITDRRGAHTVSLSLSRGCVKQCSFCSNFLTHGREFRKVPLEKVEKGIRGLPPAETGQGMHFAFEDDNILLDSDYFFSVLQIIRSRYPEATFSAENGLDYLLLSRSHVQRLAEFGFTQFNLSAGSLDEVIRKEQHRPGNADRLQEVLQASQEYGIRTILYVICGLAGDTPRTAVESMLTLLQSPADIGISPFYAVPGLSGFPASLFAEQEPGLPALLAKGSSLHPWNRCLTSLELATAFRLARTVNLLKHPQNDPELAALIRREKKLCTRTRSGALLEVPAAAADAQMTELFFSSGGQGLVTPRPAQAIAL
jgi:anaerobic magnesium-protoporphyrin IX monomethyl ester cyclase